MGFLAPWFLAGAAAVGLPVYLHLLRRHKTTPLPFSSLMFFEPRTQSSIKHRRLRYLLLLALRLAVLLLLVLAFANPFVNRSVADIQSEHLMVLAIDNSFSMRAGNRLEDARAQALTALASKPAGDRAQVLAFNSQIHQLTQPTQDPGELRAAIQGIKPSDSRATLGELARGVRAMAEGIKVPIELHVFSDLQKTGMAANFSEMALPETAKLVLHPIDKAEPNWAVESVNAPGLVWEPKTARVQVVIAGHNTKAATRTVSLVVAGKTTSTKTVEVPTDGRASVEFLSLDVPHGFTKCEVRIDSADTLPADDHMLFAVQHDDPRQVLFVHEARDTRSPLYFKTALGAAAENAFTLEDMTVDRVANVKPSNYAFVVLSDVGSIAPSFEEALRHYVQGGGSVLVAGGPNMARLQGQPVPVFGESILGGRYVERGDERFLVIGEADPSHPSIKDADRWSGIKFYYALRVNAGSARIAAQLSDHSPILLDKQIGEGRVLLFASSLDNLGNDFPTNGLFIPFIEQTSRYLAGTQAREGARQVDQFVQLRNAKERSMNVEIIDPDGGHPLSLDEARSAESFQLTREGFYEMRRANGRHEMIAANPDRRESDLEVMPADTISLWTGGETTSVEQAAAGHGKAQKKVAEQTPYSLWWYVMLFVLAAVVAESVLASRYLGIEREAP